MTDMMELAEKDIKSAIVIMLNTPRVVYENLNVPKNVYIYRNGKYKKATSICAKCNVRN
jgi:hypothetical protein